VDAGKRTVVWTGKNRCGRRKKPLWTPEKMVCFYIPENNATEAGHDFRHMRLFKTAAETGAKGPVLGMGFSLPSTAKIWC